jgi:hypothetical protein
MLFFLTSSHYKGHVPPAGRSKLWTLPTYHTPTQYPIFVLYFLFGNSPTSEVYMPTFRNTLFHLHRQVGVCRMNWVRRILLILFILHTPTCLWRWNRQNVPKRRHIIFRRLGITQKKAQNIYNTAKVWNQEPNFSSLPLLPTHNPTNMDITSSRPDLYIHGI